MNISDYPYLVASNGTQNIALVNNPKNISAYICDKGLSSDLILKTPDNKVVLTTLGPFINKCNDMDYLEQRIKPVLVKMQLNEIPTPQYIVYNTNRRNNQRIK